MKRRPLHALLLLVTVLCGQWLCIAHAVQHEAVEPASTLCDYCVSGIASGGAPAAALPLPELRADGAAPARTAPVFIRSLAAAQPRNRGPPQHA